MNKSSDLRNLLMRIDHRGYPAYKDTKGKYQFDQYILSIDHVQGDPFASPSKVSLLIPGRIAGFGKECYETKERRIAFQDYLLRRMYLKGLRQERPDRHQPPGAGNLRAQCLQCKSGKRRCGSPYGDRLSCQRTYHQRRGTDQNLI